MNGRLVALALAVALVAVWLARSTPVAPIAEGVGARPPRSQAPSVVPEAPPPPLTRDPFRYADEPAARVEPPMQSARRSSEPLATPVPPAPERIRLSGFVRRGKELKAVLWIAGTTLVAAAGESAEGYRVISIDEDAGARVRAPSGEELLLRPPGAR
jgi:hypothetical protein